MILFSEDRDPTITCPKCDATSPDIKTAQEAGWELALLGSDEYGEREGYVCPECLKQNQEG